MWNTEVVNQDNGKTRRNGRWLYPKHKYNAQFLNLPKADQQHVLAAFHVAVGQLHCFRFKDWNDYEAVSAAGDWEPMLLPTAGTMTPAQLFKRYVFGSGTKDRRIQAPVSATVVVLRNGVPVSATVDYETGLVTPLANWVAGDYTWTGEHDVWVRFNSDYNAFAIGNKNAHTSDIELIEEPR